MSKREYSLSVWMKYTSCPVKRKIGGCYEFTLNNTVILPLITKDTKLFPDDATIVSFEYITSDYISYIGAAVMQKLTFVRNVNVSDRWQSISIDLSRYAAMLHQNILGRHMTALRLYIAPLPSSGAVSFKIRNIRLRSKNEDEQVKQTLRDTHMKTENQGKIDLADYLFLEEFPCEISSVQVNSQFIHITGKTCPADSSFYLCEIPIYGCFSQNNLLPVTKIETSDKQFSMQIDRYRKSGNVYYGRLYSRWAVAIKDSNAYSLCSCGHYADRIDAAYVIVPPSPKNKKGLGAFKYNEFESDLDELGISYITFNIRINNFLRLKPEKDAIPFEYGGCIYYANAMKIAKYDRAIQSAAKRGIDVSAIILVYPENRSRDKDVGRLLEHPEFDPAGAYTMPNMTNLESLNLYAAAVDFLASRYSRPDKKYGHVHRWIVHNEVDAGWAWANAGEKTLLEYMDLYHRSMRLVYLTARKYNSNAEVLISLTHFWDIPNTEKYCYPASKVLAILLKYDQKEGSFQWGVAHHPYPESLINPRVWRETRATYGWNTKFITFNNLEMLDAWIKQPEIFYQGKKRTLLLSEQNPNSPDYTDRSLIEQAACLAYAWKKVMACDGIDAYIAHSWIDARFEGGLKTGLRKYPDDESDPFGCKPSWYLYRDLATERETESCEFAKKIIGIEDWAEIIHLYQVEKD
nr:DUF5722 domain-containing protein [uncultured Alistipes sp.]